MKIILVVNDLLVGEKITLQYVILDMMTTEYEIRRFFQPIAGNVKSIDEANTEFTNEPLRCRNKTKDN